MAVMRYEELRRLVFAAEKGEIYRFISEFMTYHFIVHRVDLNQSILLGIYV